MLRWERDRIYPSETQQKAAALGLGGVLAPMEVGGQAVSNTAACRVFEGTGERLHGLHLLVGRAQ